MHLPDQPVHRHKKSHRMSSHNSRAIKDELTLKDIDVTYSKTDTDNGINEEISKKQVDYVVECIKRNVEELRKYV